MLCLVESPDQNLHTDAVKVEHLRVQSRIGVNQNNIAATSHMTNTTEDQASSSPTDFSPDLSAYDEKAMEENELDC